MEGKEDEAVQLRYLDPNICDMEIMFSLFKEYKGPIGENNPALIWKGVAP